MRRWQNMGKTQEKSAGKLTGAFKAGADDEARTRYLHLGKVALYQMSYVRIFFRNAYYYIENFRLCQQKFSFFSIYNSR